MPNQLPNNDRTRSSPDSLPPQIQHSERVTTLRGVGQDKSASPRERIATLQPASPEIVMRSHRMDTNSSRSQKYSNKRRTVVLSLWVSPSIKSEVQRLAEKEGVSVSKLGGTLLEEAIHQKLHIQHAVLLQPIIEQAIRKQMRSISTRLALLLARGAYESGQTKRLVVHVLKRYGVNQAMLKAMLEDSSRGARNTLLRKTPQIETVLAEVEAWLEENDKDG